MMIGADLIADSFVRHGIKKLYLYPGGTIAPTLDSSLKRGLTYFCARHEQGAGYAALAEARLSGQPQVVMVTSGPGATNIVTPVADAYFDSTPLVVVTGQVGRGDMRGDRPVRQRGFQEIDCVAMMRPIAKAVFLATDTDSVGELFDRAFALAKEGRAGPVVVDLPMDVQRSLVIKAPERVKQADAPLLGSSLNEELTQQLAKTALLLSQAERPVLLVGQGVLAAKASGLLRQLVEQQQVPVVMSLLGLSAFPSEHSLSLGFLGHTGTQYANKAIHHSDLVIVLGARLDIRQTGNRCQDFAPQAKIVRIDIDPTEISYSRIRQDLTLCVDAGLALGEILSQSALLTTAAKPARQEWLAQLAGWKEEFSLAYPKNDGLFHPQEVIEFVSERYLKNNRDCVVVTGVGSHQQWVARHFALATPHRRWLTSGGHGSMGYDLPSAIGAAMANPGVDVLCFVGDGSLQINIQEFAAIIEYQVSLKIIVLDNNRLGIVSQFQNFNWSEDPSTGGKWNPDFDAIARAYGIKAYKINSSAEMRATVPEFLEQTGPALVHCHIHRQEDVVPMLLAGQTMDKMWPYA